MGMFDRVWFHCPRGCVGLLEAQSKAGDCVLRDYSPESAPPEVAVDIIGEQVWCETCKQSYTVRGQVLVHLRLE